MWLQYGVDKDNTLVDIEDASSGKTRLKCPYCGGALTAKKGKVQEHHFAHSEQTCREVTRTCDRETPTLPLYNSFNINLTGKELEKLKSLWNKYGSFDKGVYREDVLPAFIREGLLRYNKYLRYACYLFTKLGKIPVGQLSLVLFNQQQEPLMLDKLQDLEKKAVYAYRTTAPNFQECLSDLRIYRAELRKILSTTLYYLEIKAASETLYKIGVTRRAVAERVAEVQRELSAYYPSVSIKVLRTWEHRGNVEKYFKYRYRAFNYKIGSLTEYYKFDDEDAKSTLRDLRRMKPKVLSEVEQEVWCGKLSSVERVVDEIERLRAKRRSRV